MSVDARLMSLISRFNMLARRISLGQGLALPRIGSLWQRLLLVLTPESSLRLGESWAAAASGSLVTQGRGVCCPAESDIWRERA